MATAERAQEIQTVAVGQHQVEKDDVEHVPVDMQKRLFNRVSQRNIHRFALQAAPQRVGYLRFVFDDQGAHGGRFDDT